MNINTMNYLEVLELARSINFELNVGRENYDVKKMYKLGASMQELGGNLQPIEIATVDNEVVCASGNYRLNTLLNIDKINKEMEKEQNLDLTSCSFEILDLGELSLEKFRARCDLHGTQVGLTKVGIYQQIKALTDIGIISEAKIMARLGYSKGKVQEHLKTAIMSKNIEGLESAWLQNKVTRKNINELASQYKAYEENGQSITEQGIKDIESKLTDFVENKDDAPTPMKNKDIVELAKTVNELYKPLLDLVLGRISQLPEGYNDNNYILESIGNE